MKKIVLFALTVILLSTFSYASMMPSDALSWVISAKDGTWIVKGLGAASGAEGQETISWIIDPYGKVKSTGLDALDKESNGAISAGMLLTNPWGGVTNAAMQEAIKSNPELGVIKEVSAIRSELAKLGMNNGEAELVKKQTPQTGPTGAAVVERPIEITEVEGVIRPKKVPEIRIDTVEHASADGISYFTRASNKEYIHGLYRCVELVCVFKSGGTEDYIKFKNSEGKEVSYKNVESGSYFEFSKDYDNTISKASFVPTEDGAYNINGEEYKLSAGSSFKLLGRSCNNNVCKDSVSISVPLQEKVLGAVGDKELVDQTGKVSFNGKEYALLSGSKINMDVTKGMEGKAVYTLKPDSRIKYSNAKEFSKPQVFEFGNIKFETDVQRLDYQEGLVTFDGRNLGGTLKSVTTNDGASIRIPIDVTKRGTSVTDKIIVKLDDNGNMKDVSLWVSGRPATFSRGNLIINDLMAKDKYLFGLIPLTSVDPVIIQSANWNNADYFRVINPSVPSLGVYLKSNPLTAVPKFKVKSEPIPTGLTAKIDKAAQGPGGISEQPIVEEKPIVKEKEISSGLSFETSAEKVIVTTDSILPSPDIVTPVVPAAPVAPPVAPSPVKETNLPSDVEKGPSQLSREECMNLEFIPLIYPECYFYLSEWKAKGEEEVGKAVVEKVSPPAAPTPAKETEKDLTSNEPPTGDSTKTCREQGGNRCDTYSRYCSGATYRASDAVGELICCIDTCLIKPSEGITAVPAPGVSIVPPPKEEVPAPIAESLVTAKRGDTYWGMALEYELKRYTKNFDENDRQEIIAASKRGEAEFFRVLDEKFGGRGLTLIFNNDVLASSDRLKTFYGPLIAGKEIDLSFLDQPETTFTSLDKKTSGEVVMHGAGKVSLPPLKAPPSDIPPPEKSTVQPAKVPTPPVKVTPTPTEQPTPLYMLRPYAYNDDKNIIKAASSWFSNYYTIYDATTKEVVASGVSSGAYITEKFSPNPDRLQFAKDQSFYVISNTMVSKIANPAVLVDDNVGRQYKSFDYQPPKSSTSIYLERCTGSNTGMFCDKTGKPFYNLEKDGILKKRDRYPAK